MLLHDSTTLALQSDKQLRGLSHAYLLCWAGVHVSVTFVVLVCLLCVCCC